MESKPGTYALVLKSDAAAETEVGRWGVLAVRPGYYIYVGSAFGSGGVLARVLRHCRKNKRRHWHMDYLREFVSVSSVWYSHAPMRLEHRWAEVLGKMNDMEPVKGFGCTDCRCDSHLFFTVCEPALEVFAKSARSRVGLWHPEEQD